MCMVIASVGFTIVYALIALQQPRVWRIADRAITRLIGVLVVQLIAVTAGFCTFMAFLAIAFTGDTSSQKIGTAGARSLMLPAGTIVFSFIAALTHWSKHRKDGDAHSNVVVRAGVPHIQVASDLLKAELRRREEELRRREEDSREQLRLIAARLEFDTLRAEQAALAAAPAPKGDPKSWPTEVLRGEIERRNRIERISAQVAELIRENPSLRPVSSASVSAASPLKSSSAQTSRGRVSAPDPKREATELRQRLAALEEWNRQQRS